MIALAHYRSSTRDLWIQKSTDVPEADSQRYVKAHWSEYVDAAEAVLKARA
jgi:hypothetical protein